MSYKVLIIDDEDFIRENIAEMLTLLEYEVAMAVNGKDGISKIVSFQPDVILCDITMPFMNGYQVLEILRNSGAQANTPFIFLTSMAGAAERREGILMGADDYVTKPFEFSDLISAIEKQLNKSKQ
ncbi:response regulator [Runella sp.]|uniref:response regulator n=1 Tax=Runella sp. TaxID=1960881 RepID=UPI003D0FB326